MLLKLPGICSRDRLATPVVAHGLWGCRFDPRLALNCCVTKGQPLILSEPLTPRAMREAGKKISQVPLN